IRLAVPATYQNEQGADPRRMLLDIRLREPGLVATAFVAGVGQRGVMRTGAEQNGPELAVGVVNPQNGHGPIRQATRVDAENNATRRELPAVHDEVDYAVTPRQP